MNEKKNPFHHSTVPPFPESRHLMAKIAMILPAPTATVERSFSIMKLIKTPLCNRLDKAMRISIEGPQKLSSSNFDNKDQKTRKLYNSTAKLMSYLMILAKKIGGGGGGKLPPS